MTDLKERIATRSGSTFHRGLRLASDASGSCSIAHKQIALIRPEIWNEICEVVAESALSLVREEIKKHQLTDEETADKTLEQSVIPNLALEEYFKGVIIGYAIGADAQIQTIFKALGGVK